MGQPRQQHLNEFLVDLIEFVQKHFQFPITRTKILEENGCAGILLKHEPSGSELEINTFGGRVAFRAGDVRWTVEGATPADLYGKTVHDLLEVFSGRKVGPWGGAQPQT